MSSVLLDTCALIWLGNGGGELSEGALDATATAEDVFVSPISLWEVANKCRLGKLSLHVPVRDWFNALCERLCLKVMPITIEDMIMAGELPEHHKDPADRMIIATALRLSLPVVTKDHHFPEYGVETIA